MIQPLIETGLASASDETLMKAITNRRQTALRELYDRYGKTVKAVVVRVVHEEAEADDVLQEIFLQIRLCGVLNSQIDTNRDPLLSD